MLQGFREPPMAVIINDRPWRPRFFWSQLARLIFFPLVAAYYLFALPYRAWRAGRAVTQPISRVVFGGSPLRALLHLAVLLTVSAFLGLRASSRWLAKKRSIGCARAGWRSTVSRRQVRPERMALRSFEASRRLTRGQHALQPDVWQARSGVLALTSAATIRNALVLGLDSR